MFLELKDIDGHGVSFDERPGFSSIEIENGPGCPVEDARIWGVAVLGDLEVELRARVSARVEVGCARCLVPVAMVLGGDVFLLLMNEGSAKLTGEIEISANDVDVYSATGGRVDLDEIAREQIDLLVPVRTLCSADCRGLCPECGGNRNVRECDCRTDDIDPRLAPLLRWRGTKDSSTN